MSEETKPKKPRAVKATPTLRPSLPTKEDGISVDWRKLVSPQNVILNPHFYARIGIDTETIDETEKERLKKEAIDDGLIILLAGFREIAKKRGVKSTLFTPFDRTPDRAVVRCEMILEPTQDQPYDVTICGLANCSVENTTPKFFTHAEALASNRAECRAWRQYLNITSVSFEELDPNDKPEIAKVPHAATVLAEVMEKSGYTAADIPGLMENGGYELSAKWDGTIGSLENPVIFTLIGIINRTKK